MSLLVEYCKKLNLFTTVQIYLRKWEEKQISLIVLLKF